ncbi:MAG: hypothetical protein H3Z53_07360 [archaeon]|nr:hypothetical protein [archaeon]
MEIMSKKLLSVFAGGIFLISMAVFAVPIMAHTESDPLVAQLIIDGGDTGTDIGEVQVWNDGSFLYVKYVIDVEPWTLAETHVAVATSSDGIPQKNGNPIPGKFQYKAEGLSGTVYELPPMPLAWPVNTPLSIAAHAEVGYYETVIVDGVETQVWIEETAWAAGLDFSGSNWATYFTYTVQ